MRKVLFVTRADNKQGMGDLMGSLAIAEEFNSHGWHTDFRVEMNEAVEKVFKDAGFVAGYTQSNEYDVVIVNQLTTSRDDLTVLKEQYGRAKLVTIDDAGEAAVHMADLRINPLYDTLTAHKGFEYVPIDGVFRSARSEITPIRRMVGRILVTLGGADTYGFNERVNRLLLKIPLTAVVKTVHGPAVRDGGGDYDGAVDYRHQVKWSLTQRQMCKAMTWADLVICSCGLTVFQALCVGVPAVVVCAETFEEETAKRLEEKGVIVNLGFAGMLDGYTFTEAVVELVNDSYRRKEMTAKGLDLIDGKGTEKIYALIARY